MMNRDESLERLKDRLTESQLRKVMTQGYTDVSLSVMAEYNTEYARMLASCKYSPQTFNKITAAYSQKRLPEKSYLMIMDHARYTDRNEPYADAFLDSLNTIYPKTAANCFAAINYDEMSYHDAVSYVQTGAFYATDQASLSVTNEVAQELYDLHVPLRGCEGFNHCYDVDDLQASLNDGDAIFVQDKELAVFVHALMKEPDWEQFRDRTDYSKETKEITSVMFRIDYRNFQKEGCNDRLKEKINAENAAFIEEMRKRHPDEIIRSAYKIVIKETIRMYIDNYTPDLSKTQYEALLSAKDTLDEVYNEWIRSDDMKDMGDVEYAMIGAANRIQHSLEGKQQEQQAVQESVMPPQKHSKQTR